jgi:hypothetical protein
VTEDRERRVPMRLLTRPWTPDERIPTEDGRWSTRFTVKRACNGCSALLGDVTDEEMEHAIAGLAPPDVRGECPFCSRKPKRIQLGVDVASDGSTAIVVAEVTT